MINRFEEWECTDFICNSDFLDKVKEADEEICIAHSKKKERDVAWVRNHNFKTNQVRRFYSSVWGGKTIDESGDCFIISYTLPNHYVTNINNPTHIKRIEGEHNYYIWAGPKWNKFKKRTTNRRLRHSKEFQPTSKNKAYSKEYGPRSFD